MNIQQRFIITALCIALTSTTQCYAENSLESTVIPPKWDEICSHSLCDATFVPVPEEKPHVGFGLIMLSVFVPVLIPLVAVKESKAIKSDKAYVEASARNYWARRQNEFTTEVAQCNQIEANDKLVECYMNVRQIEHSKNQARKQEILMQNQINAIYALPYLGPGG